MCNVALEGNQIGGAALEYGQVDDQTCEATLEVDQRSGVQDRRLDLRNRPLLQHGN